MVTRFEYNISILIKMRCTADSSDMDVAAAEIMTLIQENEKLKERCEKAERELKEALEVKRVSLSLV